MESGLIKLTELSESRIPEGRIDREECENALGAVLFDFTEKTDFSQQKQAFFTRVYTVLSMLTDVHRRWMDFCKNPVPDTEVTSHTYHATSQLYLQESGHLERPKSWRVHDASTGPSDTLVNQWRQESLNMMRHVHELKNLVASMHEKTQTVTAWNDTIHLPQLLTIHSRIVNVVLECVPGRTFLNALKKVAVAF